MKPYKCKVRGASDYYDYSEKNGKGHRRCKQCSAARQKRYYTANPQKFLDATKRWERKNPERARAKRNLWQNSEYVALRTEILAAYGGKCTCCAESRRDFLALDHSQNDGAAHRKEIGTSTRALYLFVKRNGFPRDRFRLLCHNCNIVSWRKSCPHVAEQAKFYRPAHREMAWQEGAA